MDTIPEPLVPTASALARNRAQLLLEIATRPDSRRRRRRVTAAIASAAVLLGGATAGAIAITATPQEIAHTAYCYSRPTTDSKYTQVAGADESILSTSQGFLDACGAVWRADVFSTNQPNSTVPELHMCLGREDVFSIFPVEPGTDPVELCKALGLREAPARN